MPVCIAQLIAIAPTADTVKTDLTGRFLVNDSLAAPEDPESAMLTLAIYRIDADPLGSSDVTILEEHIVDITDDDALLEWNDASGPQLDVADLPAGLAGDTTSFQVFETYSGSLSGSPVSFTLLQFSTPTLIVATVGTFDVGDTITGTGSSIITARAVRVSPQHRIALGTGASGIALEAGAVLAPAPYLTEREGIQTDAGSDGVDYVHILLDTHEVVSVAGLWSETLFLGDTTLAALSNKACGEITWIFSQLMHNPDALGPTYLPVVTKHEARVALKDFCGFDPHDTDQDLRYAS